MEANNLIFKVETNLWLLFRQNCFQLAQTLFLREKKPDPIASHFKNILMFDIYTSS